MIVGYACLWDVLSAEVCGADPEIRETLDPFCFVDSLLWGTHDVLACIDHDTKNPIGRTGVNLKLRPDGIGLKFWLRHARLPAEFAGCSFSFDPIRWEVRGKVYRLKEGMLKEISICTMEVAYPQTKATVREILHKEKRYG